MFVIHNYSSLPQHFSLLTHTSCICKIVSDVYIRDNEGNKCEICRALVYNGGAYIVFNLNYYDTYMFTQIREEFNSKWSQLSIVELTILNHMQVLSSSLV